MKHTILIAIATILVAGCSSLDRRLKESDAIPKGESVVFGKIGLDWKIPDNIFMVDNRESNLRVIDTQRSVPFARQPLKGKGHSFYWHLPPGNYAIADITHFQSGLTTAGGSKVTTERIFAEFTVPSAGEAFYLGTLSIARRREGLSGVVSDDFDNAVQELKNRYPSVVAAPKRQLLKLEQKR